MLYKTQNRNIIIQKNQRLLICYFSLVFPDMSRFSPETEDIKRQLDFCATKVAEEIQEIFPIPEIKLSPEVLNYSKYQEFEKERYSIQSNITMNCDLYRFVLGLALMPCTIAFMGSFNSYDFPIVNLVLEFKNEKAAREFAEQINL